MEKSAKKEFDYKTIKTYEDACKKLGIDPCILPDVSKQPEKYNKATIAHHKLMIIYEAINNGWVPDWSNWDQLKYFPWFKLVSSGFAFSGSAYGYSSAHSAVGSRFCTDSSKKALYIGKQFEAEYNDYLK